MFALSWRIGYDEAKFEANSAVDHVFFDFAYVLGNNSNMCMIVVVAPTEFLISLGHCAKTSTSDKHICWRIQHFSGCPGCHCTCLQTLLETVGFARAPPVTTVFVCTLVVGNSLVTLQGFCVVLMYERPSSPHARNQMSRKLYFVGSRMVEVEERLVFRFTT